MTRARDRALRELAGAEGRREAELVREAIDRLPAPVMMNRRRESAPSISTT
jgi:hypothetical protein